MVLGAFIFNPNFNSSLQSLFGAASFSIFDNLIAYFKKDVAISTFTISKNSKVICIIDYLLKRLNPANVARITLLQTEINQLR